MPPRVRGTGRARHISNARAVVRERYCHPDDVPPDPDDQHDDEEHAMQTRRINSPEDLIKECEARNARIDRTSAGGWKVRGPLGTCTLGPRWGDPRAKQNAISDLRQYAGVDVSRPVPPKRGPQTDIDEAPEKIVIENKPRQPLAYSGATNGAAPTPADMPAANGSTPHAPEPHDAEAQPAEGVVTRADHDALLSMVEEQAAAIATLRQRLDDNAQRAKAQDATLAEYREQHRTEAARTREQVTAMSGKLAEHADHLAEADDIAIRHGKLLGDHGKELDRHTALLTAHGRRLRGVEPAAPDPVDQTRDRIRAWLADLPAGHKFRTSTVRDNVDVPVDNDRAATATARAVVKELVESGELVMHGTWKAGGAAPLFSRPEPAADGDA